MIKRQLESRAEPSPSIDRRTRPSIDDDYAALQNKLELNDILESTYARLGMQQRMIGNLQHRMHAAEVNIDRQCDTRNDRPCYIQYLLLGKNTHVLLSSRPQAGPRPPGPRFRNAQDPQYRVPWYRFQEPPPAPRKGKLPIRRTFHISEYGRLPSTPTNL
ncbi:hypothetical protein F2Q70_00003581 [Brassica cretica]|uniref:Uncharacterized protein n=1 Tax=Brassica cretica TaxID=69181 RepID=A0A8S9IKT4_BRACR|nr:hypothetical protein F2Q70_00003581 [Brassica cretica]